MVSKWVKICKHLLIRPILGLQPIDPNNLPTSWDILTWAVRKFHRPVVLRRTGTDFPNYSYGRIRGASVSVNRIHEFWRCRIRWISWNLSNRVCHKSHDASMGRLYIYLHGWLNFVVNVGKHSMHGCYGNFTRVAYESHGLRFPTLNLYHRTSAE